MSKPKGIIFRVSGGFGKNLVAIDVARAIKREHPELPLHVQASHPDAFVNLPFIDRVYPMMASPDFFDIHREFDIIDAEPYVDHGYRSGEHLAAVWARRAGVSLEPAKGSPDKFAGPNIRLSRAEMKAAEQIMGQVRNQAQGRKVVALQWLGGTSYHNPGEAQNPNRVSQVRELSKERAQEVVNKLAAKGVLVLVVGLPTEPRLENCIPLLDGNGQGFPIRVVLAVLSLVDGLIGIDSFAMHAWHALGKKGAVIVWGATTPDQLGYPENTNIKPAANACPIVPCKRPDTHLGDFHGNGSVWSCPNEAACMEHNADDIVLALEKGLEPEKNDKK